MSVKRLVMATFMLAFVPMLALSSPVWAEGGTITSKPGEGTVDPDAPAAVKAKPHKRKIVKKKAPVAAVAEHSGPVPYNSLAPDVAHALTPDKMPPNQMPPDKPVSTAALNAAQVHTPAMTPPVTSPAPAPHYAPPSVVAAAPPPANPTGEISLKCETQTSGTKQATSGTFYIDMFPSPVFPDEHADFKFLLVDPGHKSLIRDSICLDTTCSANVSQSAYYLVNRLARNGAALRITLDRTNGAFYAEEIDKANMIGQGAGHIGEKGWCKPQPLPNVMF